MNIDDETLIAYLDGELPAEGFAAVEAALASDPALARRLDSLAACDERLRRSYQAVLEEPVPPALIAAILAAPDPRRRAAPARPARVRWWQRLQDSADRWFGGRSGLALASLASVAMGAWLIVSRPAPADGDWALRAGEPVTERSLLVALETAPSGREVEAAGRQYLVLASFERHDGAVCREFNLSGNASDAADHLGVACRQSTGLWELAVVATEERPADPAHGGFRTASERQFEVVDAWRLAQTRGAPMTPEQERVLIDRGWRR
ncbi:hypothetical protein [Hydrogenophaga flava]|uniref:hypothetical protein n=1 Tax=Hydrogenophaga flava TaxID=65657 RepID=UPI000826BC79|nr:hypothetical protein [Hydrogenophaga flava]